jgi:type VI secretion system protein ImpJ
MKRQPKVVWTKGMFLLPQHFQAQDQHFQDVVNFRLGASQFANYGVTKIEVDAEKLANGMFSLISARGVMPDGEPFDMPASDELPSSREVAAYWPLSDPTLEVYLSLPELRANAPNVTLEGNRKNTGPIETRYTSVTMPAPDENEGGDERSVTVAKRAFRLLFGSEFRGGHSCLRIAQVERNAAALPILRNSFAAPCLDIASSEYLLGLLRRQVEILLTKSASLSSIRTDRGKAAGFSGSEIDKFWLLHTVNSYLPELKHLYRTRKGHPEVAFVAMLRLAGALYTFAKEGNPGDLPDYDHENLGGCFTELDARIRNLIEVVIPTKFRAIPLIRTERDRWMGSIEDDNLFRNNSQFYLAVSGKMGVVDLIQQAPRYLKVAAPDDLERIVSKATAGLVLSYAPVKPVNTKQEDQYFQINQSGPLWDKVVLSRSIGVYASADIVEPKMELVAVWE